LQEHPLILCAAGVQDPGNIGALVRSAAAAGADMVCTTSGTVSARNPKAVRASAGAIFRLPVVEHLPPPELRRYCEQRQIRMYRAEAEAAVDYRRVDLRESAALVLGNEARGAADPEWADAPAIRIPMAKGVESLNVAAAGAVLLFEAARQRLT
jgi:TrmH family RNA methyltransferase